MFKPEGINPALVTPFTDDGKSVDETRLRALVNHCIELGVHGVVPCGTTGEFTNLTIEERKKVIEIVIDEVNGRVPVIAGTGAGGTDQAVEMTKTRQRRRRHGGVDSHALLHETRGPRNLRTLLYDSQRSRYSNNLVQHPAVHRAGTALANGRGFGSNPKHRRRQRLKRTTEIHTRSARKSQRQDQRSRGPRRSRSSRISRRLFGRHTCERERHPRHLGSNVQSRQERRASTGPRTPVQNPENRQNHRWQRSGRDKRGVEHDENQSRSREKTTERRRRTHLRGKRRTAPRPGEDRQNQAERNNV